jgi:hypothetical protein
MYNRDTGPKILKMRSDDRVCNLTECINVTIRYILSDPIHVVWWYSFWSFIGQQSVTGAVIIGNTNCCMACQRIRRWNEIQVLNGNSSAAVEKFVHKNVSFRKPFSGYLT